MLRFVTFKKIISFANFGPSTAAQNWGCQWIFLEIMTYHTGKRVVWSEVNSAMFGAEPYQFEPTYPPGEEPALHGERSASPEPAGIRTGVRVWRKDLVTLDSEDDYRSGSRNVSRVSKDYSQPDDHAKQITDSPWFKSLNNNNNNYNNKSLFSRILNKVSVVTNLIQTKLICAEIHTWQSRQELA